ncbi:MAG: hypothetical protein FJ050_09455 [Cyanobacteria bacterium M_surface_7_m2_040]|nr:hypothetical protein [Cyanobacteria bacterium M_surface_7_m2_040]
MEQRHPVGIKVSLLALLLSGTPALAIPNPNPSPYPQPMPGQTLLFPSAGVVCDQPAQRCFDSMGLSLGLTRQYFGAFAEQNALNSLGGRRPGPVFQLSDGSRCNVRQSSCWSGAGYGQPIINQQLTSQLFGGMPRPNPYPAPSPGPAPQPAPGGYTGLCRLMRGNSNVFNGACALNEVRQGYQPRFEVQFQNGPRYVFEQSGGGYQIADGTGGGWPVQFSDNGRNGQFRWADMVLNVTQNNYLPESNPNARMGRAIGNFLIDLFN